MTNQNQGGNQGGQDNQKQQGGAVKPDPQQTQTPGSGGQQGGQTEKPAQQNQK